METNNIHVIDANAVTLKFKEEVIGDIESLKEFGGVLSALVSTIVEFDDVFRGYWIAPEKGIFMVFLHPNFSREKFVDDILPEMNDVLKYFEVVE